MKRCRRTMIVLGLAGIVGLGGGCMQPAQGKDVTALAETEQENNIEQTENTPLVTDEETIIIPGLEQEYRFLYLTDTHVIIKSMDDLGSLGKAEDRIAGFTDAQGITSADRFPEWMDYANETQVDAVWLGGDVFDYYSRENVTFVEKQLQTLEMPFLYTLGNHELFEPVTGTYETSDVISSFFVDGNSVFQKMEYEELIVCSVDDESYQINPDALEPMRETVEQAKKEGKAIILLVHVPLYTEQAADLKDASVAAWGQALIIGEGARDTTEVTREFLNLILAEDSPVVWVIAGDNHFYYKGQLTNQVTETVMAPGFSGNAAVFCVKGD